MDCSGWYLYRGSNYWSFPFDFFFLLNKGLLFLKKFINLLFKLRPLCMHLCEFTSLWRPKGIWCPGTGVTVSCLMYVLGRKPRSFSRALSALHHSAISPAPRIKRFSLAVLNLERAQTFVAIPPSQVSRAV